MAMQKIQGARPPLLERLTDEYPLVPIERQTFKVLNKNELRESVRREITWLLNTRSPIPQFMLEKQTPVTFNYGIPDLFSLFHPLTPEKENKLCALLARAISAFEPRIKRTKISFERYDIGNRSLMLRLDGVIMVANIVEQLSFTVTLYNNMHGKAEVNEVR